MQGDPSTSGVAETRTHFTFLLILLLLTVGFTASFGSDEGGCKMPAKKTTKPLKLNPLTSSSQVPGMAATTTTSSFSPFSVSSSPPHVFLPVTVIPILFTLPLPVDNLGFIPTKPRVVILPFSSVSNNMPLTTTPSSFPSSLPSAVILPSDSPDSPFHHFSIPTNRSSVIAVVQKNPNVSQILRRGLLESFTCHPVQQFPGEEEEEKEQLVLPPGLKTKMSGEVQERTGFCIFFPLSPQLLLLTPQAADAPADAPSADFFIWQPSASWHSSTTTDTTQVPLDPEGHPLTHSQQQHRSKLMTLQDLPAILDKTGAQEREEEEEEKKKNKKKEGAKEEEQSSGNISSRINLMTSRTDTFPGATREMAQSLDKFATKFTTYDHLPLTSPGTQQAMAPSLDLVATTSSSPPNTNLTNPNKRSQQPLLSIKVSETSRGVSSRLSLLVRSR